MLLLLCIIYWPHLTTRVTGTQILERDVDAECFKCHLQCCEQHKLLYWGGVRQMSNSAYITPKLSVLKCTTKRNWGENCVLFWILGEPTQSRIFFDVWWYPQIPVTPEKYKIFLNQVICTFSQGNDKSFQKTLSPNINVISI